IATGIVGWPLANVDRLLANPDVAKKHRPRRDRDGLGAGMKDGVLRIVDTQLDRALARDGHRKPADGIGAIERLYLAFRAARADRDARFRFAAFRHAAPND